MTNVDYLQTYKSAVHEVEIAAKSAEMTPEMVIALSQAASLASIAASLEKLTENTNNLPADLNMLTRTLSQMR